MNQISRGWRWRVPLLALTLSIAAALAFAGAATAHHHDHEGDQGGDPAGTISSYDAGSGVLTIDLAKGGSISALVTDRTMITVGGDCGKGDRHARHGRKDARHGKAQRAWRHRAQRAWRHRWGDGGSHHGWGHDRGHGWGDSHRGSTDDLTPGTVVDDAVLVLVDGTAVYAKVDLETPSSGEAN